MSSARITHADRFDAEICRHNERFRAAAAIGQGERVLDVGCGTGESTRQAAGAARGGSVLGLDVWDEALEVARRLTADAGLTNVSYVAGDAQTFGLPPGEFDVAISRFGTMFFADPGAAFGNIATALRAGGRLVLLVWQAHDRNEWSAAVREVMGAADASIEGPDAFSLGDPAVVEPMLSAAGFAGIDFADVDDPVYYGPDVATATEFVVGLRDTQSWLARLDPPAAERARARLHELLTEHATGDGVFMGSRAWIITARRR